MVDDEGGEGSREAEGLHALSDVLVNGTLEEDSGMTAKEAGVEAADEGGVGAGAGDEEGVGEGALVAGAAVGGRDVVPAPEIEGGEVGLRVSLGDGLGKKRDGGGVEHLVGVEDQDPVAAAVLEDAVAGVAEVVLPGDGDNFGSEGAGDGDGVIGGAGVAEDDAVDERSDTLEAAPEAGCAVFHDHREFDAGVAHTPHCTAVRELRGEDCTSGSAARFHYGTAFGKGLRVRDGGEVGR